MGSALYHHVCVLLFLSWLPVFYSFTISSFHYPVTKLRPYDWRYIRVNIPPEFSSIFLNISSDVDIDIANAGKVPKKSLPTICFRNGSPPLPDVSNTSLSNLVLSGATNESFGNIQDLQRVVCHPLQNIIKLVLTTEQIPPGVWYVGLFNGIGLARTQGRMIVRGSEFSVSADVRVDGCTTSTLWGPYCNETIVPLLCAQSDVYKDSRNFSDANQTADIVTTCRNSDDACHGYSALRGYSLDILGTVQQLTIMATNVRFNSSANSTSNASAVLYARHGAIPSSTFHDYSSDINNTTLVIQSPKVGRWYFSALPVNQMRADGVTQDKNKSLCYSLDWEVLECPLGKAGPNCTWESYMLQMIPNKNPTESHYLPISGKISQDSFGFPLEPLLSNSSLGNTSGFAWTYFMLVIPPGAAGKNLHVQLKSDAKLDYEIYARFGGLPSLDTSDYYYANRTSSTNSSVLFRLYDSSAEQVSFGILYAKEGTWFFGLRHPIHASDSFKHHTTMVIASERCPKGCLPHGKCVDSVDASGLTVYSYCSCDRAHGGFDCSVEIISPKGHRKQSIALIASNAAAILPAFYALHQKAFAEWVLFTSSGIASGLYHACDVGTWCILSFKVLQFMDFWLSFMAVVSTFIFLTTVDEGMKRTMHTVVAILTGLMAANGPTKSSNIVYVIAIGIVGLVIGLIMESSTYSYIRSISCTTRLRLNIIERWATVRHWFYNLLKTLRNRLRWIFVIPGFVFFALAAISWTAETSESYWIWHSTWHVSIYTSSFFFLCSKVRTVNTDNGEVQAAPTYELARQDSFSRGEMN